jgi:hypothetical protein
MNVRATRGWRFYDQAFSVCGLTCCCAKRPSVAISWKPTCRLNRRLFPGVCFWDFTPHPLQVCAALLSFEELDQLFMVLVPELVMCTPSSLTKELSRLLSPQPKSFQEGSILHAFHVHHFLRWSSLLPLPFQGGQMFCQNQHSHFVSNLLPFLRSWAAIELLFLCCNVADQPPCINSATLFVWQPCCWALRLS